MAEPQPVIDSTATMASLDAARVAATVRVAQPKDYKRSVEGRREQAARVQRADPRQREPKPMVKP